MKKIYQIKGFFLFNNILRTLLVYLLLSSQSFSAFAQCPPNIDFEEGTFNHWKLFSRDDFYHPDSLKTMPQILLPIAGRHDILSNPPGNGLDLYGQFPVNCPNGSGHSIKLGSSQVGNNQGHRADKATYTFTIPAGQNTFNLIYHYAFVLNDAGHTPDQQPRLVIDVKNITDGLPLPCPLPPIVATASLPGILTSGSTANGQPVLYRPWNAGSILLDNLAGKTIELSFATSGCGLTNGSHFGYAYVDVNTECGSSFIGAVFCPDDAFVNVTAPFGYDTYTWYDDAALTIPIGFTQTINFTPPPPAGTIKYIKMDPYPGYGCTNVLAAELLDTLTIQSVAGADQLSCQNAPVQLGGPPKATYVYSWSPVTGLSDPNIANPIATPSVTTEYVVTTTSAGGGCLTTDTVIVKAAVLDNTVSVTGPLTGCITAANPTVLKVNDADSIQWYRNTFPIPGANDTVLNVIQTGTYHATVFSFVGCDLTSTDITITVNPTPVVGFTHNAPNQCFNGHQFVFTDTSSIAFGTLSYVWDMGDATALQTTQNISYSYALPGTYTVKQLVVSDQGCTDSAFYTVTVFDSPVAAFDSDIKGTCFKNNQFKFTNSSTLAVGTMKYLWDFGDTKTDTTRDVTHSYTQPGTYTVRLTTTSDKGCPNDSAFSVTVYPDPVVGFSEPNAIQCFGNNQFNFINSSTILTGTMGYAWYLGDGATASTRDVTHSYAGPGEFIVKMVVLSDKGCTDSTTNNYKVIKYAVADFKVDPICTDLRLPLFNRTINTSPSTLTYLWDFGNGDISTVSNPVYSYPNAGTYTIQLSVSDINCPQTISVKKLDVVVDAPATGIRYADVEAVMNFPEQLQARQIAGSSILWTPSISLDFTNSSRPKFTGLASQLYHVQFKTRSGCLTVDTQYVKIKKKIEVLMPTSFTPNGDGVNDYLYPTLMGFQKLTYFRVYDRWGKMLFQTQNEKPGWDGRVNGDKVAIQTVVWMVEAVDVDGIAHKQQGTTVLLR
jgi:gliding motility-associated-like protein